MTAVKSTWVSQWSTKDVHGNL